MIGKHGRAKLLGFSAFVAVWTLTVGGCIDGDTGTQGPAGPEGPAGPTNITQIDTGPGLTGGPITATGTISIMPGNADGQILRWDNSAGQWFLDSESPRLITYVSGYNVLHQAVNTTETVTGRTLSFTKQYAGSRLRITYSDALKLVNTGSIGAWWEVYLDGAPIANPAPLKMALPHPGGLPGAYRQSTLVGYAEGVSAGAHTISVQVNASALTTETSTGKDSTFLLEVEEIR